MTGTPAYIAPEILLAHKSRKGYKNTVDVWSFGLMIFEMINKHHRNFIFYNLMLSLFNNKNQLRPGYSFQSQVKFINKI